MLYAIRDSFGPACGARWQDYCGWRGLALEGFASIDCILRPSLFTPRSAEDWAHVVPANFMIEFITDREYALRQWREIGRGSIVGVTFELHDETQAGFLGFDLVDGALDISLLTNWGNRNAGFDSLIGPNGLIRERAVVESVRRDLLATGRGDGHVAGCRAVAVYEVPAEAPPAGR